MTTSPESFDFWMFLAGLGLFLFGMYHVEKGINGLTGRSFKKFLKSFTDKPWKGILTGTITSGILQSSTLVNLLTAAFLGGGLMTLQNALGVVFGANIGTTFTSWIVAYFGFTLDISSFSFPFLAMGCLSYLFMDQRPFWKSLGSLLMGFGLLFLGIDFMKDAVMVLTSIIDFSKLSNLNIWVFIFLGTVITALIQSSSAMMVIVLSALFGQIIDIYQACAFSIGANIGTTLSLVLASIKGTGDKKRLAAGHVIFNVVGGLLAVIFLPQITNLLKVWFHIHSSVILLSAFNTFMNVAGVILFLPFIPALSRMLNRFFIKQEIAFHAQFISKVNTDVTEVALAALDKEIHHVFMLTREFVFKVLEIEEEKEKNHVSVNTIWKKEENPISMYNHIKITEDEITTFYKKLQTKNLSSAETNILAAHMIRLRSLVYAAKNMKDIIANVKEIIDNEESLPIDILQKLQHFTKQKMEIFTAHITMENKDNLHEKWTRALDLFYHKTIDYLYDQISVEEKIQISVSTITNVIKKTVSCLEELANAATDEDHIRESITELYG